MLTEDKLYRAVKILERDYEFCECKATDYSLLIEFLEQHWKKNYILTRWKELLDWYYFDKTSQTYHFWLAKHRGNGEIHAITGYIPTGQFDSKLGKRKVWGSIWKAREDVKNLGLGVATQFMRLRSYENLEWAGGYGVSDMGLKNVRSENPVVGKMKQYFIPNEAKKHFVIASGLEDIKCAQKKEQSIIQLKEIHIDEYRAIKEDDDIFKKSSKYKSKTYYENRYLLCPFYKYDFYEITDGSVRGIIIIRCVEAEGSFCLRIVDYIGDLENLRYTVNCWQNLLAKYDAEYIDFMETGIEGELLEDSGFIDRETLPNVVVPNYFEPFEKRNVDLAYQYTDYVGNAGIEKVIFKGDCDQDRPNVLPNER